MNQTSNEFKDLREVKLKKIITIIILVSLAFVSISSSLITNAKAQTTQASVVSYSWYIAPTTTVLAEWPNDLIAVGEVQNTGTNNLATVWVAGAAKDINGTVLASTGSQVFVRDMLPGQKAPFYMDFTPESSATFDSSASLSQNQVWISNVTSVTITTSTLTPTNVSVYSGLDIPTGSDSGSNISGTYTVTGTILNSGNQAVSDIWVFATFYNSLGTVVAMNFTDIATSLQPAGTVTFSATPIDNTVQLSNSIASYSLLIQPIQETATPTPPPSPTPTTEPTPTPTATTQPTQSPTPLGSELTTVIVIVIVILIILAVFVALFLIKNHHKEDQLELPPPPPPPPPP